MQRKSQSYVRTLDQVSTWLEGADEALDNLLEDENMNEEYAEALADHLIDLNHEIRRASEILKRLKTYRSKVQRNKAEGRRPEANQHDLALYLIEAFSGSKKVTLEQAVERYKRTFREAVSDNTLNAAQSILARDPDYINL